MLTYLLYYSIKPIYKYIMNIGKEYVMVYSIFMGLFKLRGTRNKRGSQNEKSLAYSGI